MRAPRFVDEDCYVAEIRVAGLPALHRGRQFVSADGTVRGARLKRHLKDEKTLGTWNWFDNPFLGKREFNGPRVMMSLVDNWDLKQIDNAVREMDGERRYLVSDLGATFDTPCPSSGELRNSARSDRRSPGGGGPAIRGSWG